MTREEIENMKDECKDGKEIVEQLIENSASFHQKTKFSQAKFLKKKAKKYCQYLVIKKPSIRLIMNINYKQDPMKMMNLRIDSLAQILNSANINSHGKFMIYETGTQGVLVASALERCGTSGQIAHIFQTGCPQTQSLSVMNFSKERLDSQISTINMYHLRALEQGKYVKIHKNALKGLKLMLEKYLEMLFKFFQAKTFVKCTLKIPKGNLDKNKEKKASKPTKCYNPEKWTV